MLKEIFWIRKSSGKVSKRMQYFFGNVFVLLKSFIEKKNLAKCSENVKRNLLKKCLKVCNSFFFVRFFFF